jgi:olefin beta-lactone synthetase
MNLLAPLLDRDHLRAFAGRTAIIAANGETATYDDLLLQSARLAAAWRRKGIEAGDRVLLILPLGISLYVGLIALWRLGAVVVLPEPALGFAGVRVAVAAAQPKAILASGWLRALRYVQPSMRHTVALSPSDARKKGAAIDDQIAMVNVEHPALISFTSGSTGRPKTIVRSHGFLAHQNSCVADLLRPDHAAIDLVAFPVFVLANLALGVTSVLPNWDVRHHDLADATAIAEHLRRHAVTRALVPPSICEKLAAAAALELRALFTGGGPVFPDLLQRLALRLPRANIVTVYGSTEAEPIAHQSVGDLTAADWEAMRSGGGLLAGPCIPAIKVKIVRDEIVVTGAHVNKSYLDPTDNTETKLLMDGEIWHRTGDAGRLDERGRLWLLGRLDGRAGSLFPFCVEAAARFWPGVAQAALVATSGRPVLAIVGEPSRTYQWQREADRIGDIRVTAVDAIPLDRRHRAKVDYPALRKLLSV